MIFLRSLSFANRQAFVLGIHAITPSLFALFSWGLVTGVSMVKSSLTFWQAIGMSLFVYAGSAQLAVLAFFTVAPSLFAIWAVALIVNLRFIIFSAGLQPHFSSLPLWRRILIGYFNTDLGFMVFIKQDYPPGYQTDKEAFFYGMAVMTWVVWQSASLLGILLAAQVPDHWELGFAGTLVLIPLMLQVIVNRSTACAVCVAAAFAMLTLNLPHHLNLVVAIIAALATGMACDRCLAYIQLKQSQQK